MPDSSDRDRQVGASLGLDALESGERLAFSSGHYTLSCDRPAGRLTITRRSVTGNSSDQVIPLPALTGFCLDWSDDMARPSLSGLVRAFKAGRTDSGGFDEQAADAALQQCRALSLTLWHASDAGPRTTRLPLRLHSVERIEQLVELGLHLAAAAGLPAFGVFRVADLNLEIRAANAAAPGFGELPPGEDRQALQKYIARLLRHPALPPFDPGSLNANLAVVDWRPGTRIAFRRGVTPVVVPLALGSCLLFAGPALAVSRWLRDQPLDVVTLGIVTLISCGIGGALLWLLLRRLPRSVVFDWDERCVTVRSPLRTTALPFRQIECIGMTANDLSTTAGGGGESATIGRSDFSCDLEVLSAGATPALLVLETSRSLPRADALRQAVPLARELAQALGVKCRLRGRGLGR